MKLISCNGNRPLAEAIAKHIGIKLCDTSVRNFADKEIFYGPIAEYADTNCSVIPDFISNCGMARVFAYLMNQRRNDVVDKDIFQDCSELIRIALSECYNINKNKNNIMSKALEIALKKLLIK